MVSSPLEANWLRYHLKMWNVIETEDNWHVQIIMDRAGMALGFLLVPIMRWGKNMDVFALEVRPEVNLQAVLPPLLRALAVQGQHLEAKPGAGPFLEISFSLGVTHPVYEVLGRVLTTRLVPPYAWYVRVADVPRFLQHISPALEQRLQESPLGSYSGEVRISLYRGGLRLVFEDGRLKIAESWSRPAYSSSEDGAVPPLV